MHYREYAPSPFLRQYIDCYWEHRILNEPGAIAVEQRCLPLGTAEIIIQTNGDLLHYYLKNEVWERSDRVFITGLFQETAIWKAEPGSVMFGIRLKPEAFIGLFGVPAAYLFNQLEDAVPVFGAFAKSCEQQMSGVNDIRVLIEKAEQLLLKKLAGLPGKNNVVVNACRLIRASNAVLSLDDICRELYVSPRSLERYFKAQFGSGPKLYQRIVRFSKAYSTIQAKRNNVISWADICYDHGYTDQAYFIREFKTFSGFSPAGFIRETQTFEPSILSVA